MIVSLLAVAWLVKSRTSLNFVQQQQQQQHTLTTFGLTCVPCVGGCCLHHEGL